METVFGQTLALQLGNGDEHRALESDTPGLNDNDNNAKEHIPWQLVLLREQYEKEGRSSKHALECP